MKQNLFLVPAVVLLLACLATGCDKAHVETPDTDTIGTTHPEWEDTITIRINFGEHAATRATVSEAKVTDLWLMDYVGGELQQTIHQQKTDEGFGSVQMAVSYGTHQLKVVASAGTGAVLSDSILTWTKPGDTFYASQQIEIAPQGDKSVALHLERIATRLKIIVNDEIPADFATLSIAATWYYGLNVKSGEATEAQTQERTISVPASYVGTTGQLTAGFYSLCPSDGYTTDVTIRALRSDESALRTISLHDVELRRNRMTAYSGEMFQNTRSVGLDVDTDWTDALEATW